MPIASNLQCTDTDGSRNFFQKKSRVNACINNTELWRGGGQKTPMDQPLDRLCMRLLTCCTI